MASKRCDVTSFVASGNIAFLAEAGADEGALRTRIEPHLHGALGNRERTRAVGERN